MEFKERLTCFLSNIGFSMTSAVAGTYLFVSINSECEDFISVISNINITDSFIDLFVSSMLIFFFIFKIICFAAVIGKGLQTLMAAFYYLFFYDDYVDTIHWEVNNDNIIKNSYMVLKNGKVIPIVISKIKVEKPEIENREEIDV